MPKTENRGGARVANPDYKKIRIEAFDMIAKLITSNEILTQSLKHNEILQRKCLNTIKDMKAKMAFLNQWDELTKEYFERTERFGKGHIL